jgi:hypothetical protein
MRDLNTLLLPLGSLIHAFSELCVKFYTTALIYHFNLYLDDSPAIMPFKL